MPASEARAGLVEFAYNCRRLLARSITASNHRTSERVAAAGAGVEGAA
jgi:hypothetical protein